MPSSVVTPEELSMIRITNENNEWHVTFVASMDNLIDVHNLLQIIPSDVPERKALWDAYYHAVHDAYVDGRVNDEWMRAVIEAETGDVCTHLPKKKRERPPEEMLWCFASPPRKEA